MDENNEVTEVENEETATDTAAEPLADWELALLADASSNEKSDNSVRSMSEDEARAFAQAHTDYPIADPDSRRRSARHRLKSEPTEEPAKDTTADDLNACLKVVEGWIAENERAPKRKLRGDDVTLDDVAQLGAVMLHHTQMKYPGYSYEGCRPIAHSLLSPFEYLLRFDHFVDRDGDNIYSSFVSDVTYAAIRAGTLGESAFITSLNKWMSEPEKAEVAFRSLNEVLKPRKDKSHQPGSQWYTSDEDLVKTSQLPAGSTDELLTQLNSMKGLGKLKDVVGQQIAMIKTDKIRQQRGFRTPERNRHIMFTGNPGTGKTTAARLIAGIYRSLGIVENDYIVEVDASGLISKWNGQTPGKTNKAIDEALGGVFFVDEAYSLTGDRGQEALDALVKRMEDDRDDLVVILAGYPGKMDELLKMNPGIKSRLGLTINFPDYNDADLVTILEAMALEQDFIIEDDALTLVSTRLKIIKRNTDFGNARVMRNLFEAATGNFSKRIDTLGRPDKLTDEQLTQLTTQDFVAALDQVFVSTDKPKMVGFGQVAR